MKNGIAQLSFQPLYVLAVIVAYQLPLVSVWEMGDKGFPYIILDSFSLFFALQKRCTCLFGEGITCVQRIPCLWLT